MTRGTAFHVSVACGQTVERRHYLVLDLDGKSVRLLALDAQSRYGQHQVAIFQNLSPLQQRVDLLGSDTSDGCQQLGDVGAVDVDLVVGGEGSDLLKLRH